MVENKIRKKPLHWAVLSISWFSGSEVRNKVRPHRQEIAMSNCVVAAEGVDVRTAGRFWRCRCLAEFVVK